MVSFLSNNFAGNNAGSDKLIVLAKYIRLINSLFRFSL